MISISKVTKNLYLQHNKLNNYFFMLIFALKFFIITLINTFLVTSKEPEMPFKAKVAPPGTIWLKDSIYIDLAPTRNIDYKEFESFVQITYNKVLRDSLKNIPYFGIDMEEFKKFMRGCKPDKALASKVKIPMNAKLGWSMNISEYYNSSVYAGYPIIYVSMSQAIEYCNWRTDITMLVYSAQSKNEKERSKFYKKIRYRLPKIEEMEYALEKFKDNIQTDLSMYAGDICATMPAPRQKKKKKFIYIPYNVSEITSTESTAIGFSWRDTDTTKNYSKTVKYSRPQDWLSFRCVCEIIEY